MDTLIKYGQREFNPAISPCRTIRLGTVKYYRSQANDQGIHDSEEGIIYYKKFIPQVELTSAVSSSYFNNAVSCDGAQGLIFNGSHYSDSMEIAYNIGDGPNGYVVFHGESVQGIRVDLTKYFLIFSMNCTEELPTLSMAKTFSASYNSCYEVTAPDVFSRAIAVAAMNKFTAQKLKLECPEPEAVKNVNINWHCARVDYKESKNQILSNDPIDHLQFEERLKKAIFNKNTIHDHEYQNEYRMVFWFTDQDKQLLTVPDDPVDVTVDGIERYIRNIDLA